MTELIEPSEVQGPKTDFKALLAKVTRPNGSVNWAQFFTMLAALGGISAIGAAVGGGKGALAAAGSGLKGMTEGYEAGRESRLQSDKLELLGRRQTLDEEQEAARQKREEDERKGKAPATRTSHDIEGKEILEEWDTKTQTWKEVRKGRRPETPRNPPHTEKRQRYDQEGNIHYEERIDGKWVETAPPGRSPRREPPSEKPPPSSDLRTEIESRKKEIERLSLKVQQPDPANPGKTMLAMPPGNQEQIDKLKTEIEQFKTELKSRGETILQKLGKAGKATSDTTRTKGGEPDRLPAGEFDKLKEGVATARAKGLSDADIRSKLIAAAAREGKTLSETTLKMLGL